MYKLTIKGEETFDEETNTFIPAMNPITLTLEHSLISISKWESKTHKPYLSTTLTMDETLFYIECMTISPIVSSEVYRRITPQQIKDISEYISNPMSATWFSGKPGSPHTNGRMNGQIITSEVVYSWMVQQRIPVEFEKWHLNRLLTLIRVIGEENAPKKKMSQAEITRRYADLNAQRKAMLHTKG